MIKYVFDEHIPPKLTQALRLLRDGEDITCIKELGFRGLPDTEIFCELGSFTTLDNKCIFISGDKKIRRTKPEHLSLTENNLIALFCPPSFNTKSLWGRSLYIIYPLKT